MSNKTIGRRILRCALWSLCTVAAILSVWLLTVTLCRPNDRNPDTSRWQSGYIFFSVGDSWKSVAVRSLTSFRDFNLRDSTPSHCGIVLRMSDGIRLIHESTSAGHIVSETPDDYFRINGSHCIYALPANASIDTMRLRQETERLLNIRKPFDYDFDHNDSTAFYCSEMAVYLLEKTGMPSVSILRESEFIYPDDIKKYISTGKSQFSGKRYLSIPAERP